MAKNDNYQERSKSTVTLKPLAHTAIKKRSKRVKSIAQYRRQHFGGMSDALSFTVQPAEFQPVDAVTDHARTSSLSLPDTRAMKYAKGKHGNPIGRMAGHSDMLAKASDEKTKAINLAVRLRRVPIAVQLNALLAHKQKLISQADKAANQRKLDRARALIDQIERNELKIKALVAELQDNGVDFDTLNSAFAKYL